MKNNKLYNNNLKLLLSILTKKQKKNLIYVFILMLLGMLFEMIGLGILLPIMELMVNPNNESKSNLISNIFNAQNNFILLLLILVLFFFIKLFFILYMVWKQNKFAAEVSKFISDKLFYGYLSEDYQFHLNKNSSILIRNISIEVTKITSVITTTLAGFTELLVVFGTTLFLLFIEPIGTFIIFFLIFNAFIAFNYFTKKKLVKWGLNMQSNSALMNKDIMEGLGGIKEVIFYNKQLFFLKNFSFHNFLYYQDQIKNNTLSQFPKYFLELVSIISLSGLIFLLISLGNPVSSILPILGIFLTSAFRLIPSANRIIVSFQHIKFSAPTIHLVHDEFQAFEKTSVIKSENNCNINFENFREISFSNVTFSYENQINLALDSISLNFNSGNTIGIFGESGSGKSTFVDLFLGILKPVKGKIFIDNIDIHSSLINWQSLIGYIPQSVYLLDDSILKNIAFGINEEDIDFKKIELALEKSNLTNFIDSLPSGFYTHVGERGVRLSGGQRQRIGIARALYNDPLILVLDEATSALDNETEHSIMDSIDNLKGQKTILIVAHRLTTIKNCDYLYKIKNGTIESEGKPDKLLINI
jgi:ABC-type multidrug transport system fused ATPase/permease subunit